MTLYFDTDSVFLKLCLFSVLFFFFFFFFSYQALSCHLSLVAVEVTLSLQRLVKKYGQELHVVAWDAVLDIIEALQQEIEVWNDVSREILLFTIGDRSPQSKC